jgi:glycosyltransferase involved in cell wall biosynthesis
MVITGKLSARKQVVETLECFSQVSDDRFKVVLAGSMPEDTEPGITDCIRRDDRVEFVGWKSADELGDLLCAADVYLQPGSQSATMQMSLCARCPVILADVLSHEPFVSGNGWLVKDAGGLLDAFQDISNAPEALEAMSTKSHEIARRLLDYNRLAERLLC